MEEIPAGQSNRYGCRRNIWRLPIWRDIDLDKLAVRTIVEKELGLLLERAGRHGK